MAFGRGCALPSCIRKSRAGTSSKISVGEPWDTNIGAIMSGVSPSILLPLR